MTHGDDGAGTVILRIWDRRWCFGAVFRDRALVDAAPAYHKIVGKRDLVEAIRWLYRNPKWDWQKIPG